MSGHRVEQHRSRYNTVAFRVSDDELTELNARIKLSGRDKQDYLIKSVLYQTLVVIGNRVQFESLSSQLNEIAEHLRNLGSAADFDPVNMVAVRTAVEIISGFIDSERPWDGNEMTRALENGGLDDKSGNSRTKSCWSGL